MRAICFYSILLTAGTALVASADEPAMCPARPCPREAYLPPTATTTTPIEVEIRVLEIKDPAPEYGGFGVSTSKAGLSPLAQLVNGSVLADSKSGSIGFLDGLHREGMVYQDMALSGQVVDGDSRETILRWRSSNATAAQHSWRHLRLRIRPTLIAGGIRLETAVRAELSNSYQPPPADGQSSLVDFGAETAGQTVALAANFVAADPEQPPREDICAVVLITPRWLQTSATQSDCDSCPELLAPRNVLHRRAARTAGNPVLSR